MRAVVKQETGSSSSETMHLHPSPQSSEGWGCTSCKAERNWDHVLPFVFRPRALVVTLRDAQMIHSERLVMLVDHRGLARSWDAFSSSDKGRKTESSFKKKKKKSEI